MSKSLTTTKNTNPISSHTLHFPKPTYKQSFLRPSRPPKLIETHFPAKRQSRASLSSNGIKTKRYATFNLGKLLQYNLFKALLQDSKMQDLSNGASRTNGRWTKEQHLKFLEGLRIYGKNWKKIEQLVSTRTGTQIRSHAQKFFLKSKQPAATESQELSQICSDFVDEHQEATLNSKTSSESGPARQDSYFLTKIIQYSNSKQCLDFWSALIDCRDATAILNKPIRNSSFMAFQQGNQGESTGGLMHKIQA